MDKPKKVEMDKRVQGMRPPEYWLERHSQGETPREIWVHALDILEHILRGDTEKTMFKAPLTGGKAAMVTTKYGYITMLEHLQEAMQDPPKPDPEFENIIQNCFRKKKKYKMRPGRTGQRFNVPGYINHLGGEKSARPFRKYYKTTKREAAKTLIFEMCTPWSDRNRDYMRDRHKIIYSVALSCEAKNIPCRVVGYYGNYTSVEGEGKFRFFVVIKDYNERIYPGIWGALQTCATSNSFENSIMSYFIGTKSSCNGYPHLKAKIEKYIPSDEDVLIVNGRTVTYEGANNNVDEYLGKIKQDWNFEGGYDGYKKS